MTLVEKCDFLWKHRAKIALTDGSRNPCRGNSVCDRVYICQYEAGDGEIDKVEGEAIDRIPEILLWSACTEVLYCRDKSAKENIDPIPEYISILYSILLCDVTLTVLVRYRTQ